MIPGASGNQRKGGQMPRQAGKRLPSAAWFAGPLALLLGLAMIVWLAAPAAPATAALTALATPIPFRGTPTVGALFTVSDGRLGTHFCTASVVHSPAGNLVLTAAHCLAGNPGTGPGGIAFVPGYDDGAAPAGVWLVTQVFVDPAWAATADPDDDFAFLTVAQPGQSTPIEKITGAEGLGTGAAPAAMVHVIGYPDAQAEPIICQNRTSMFSPTQTQFDCDGYTEGTSGSPLLTGAATASGEQTVIGVIGGYQQGGDSPDVSYAAAFGPSVQALYEIAAAQG
jgi:V8-like Glu-specific endopeptidase